MVITRWLGRVGYESTYASMQAFTEKRSQDKPGCDDEIWMCEHDPVFTQGLAGKPEHILNAGAIPVVQSNRGGQVTYHGPGQVMAYAMVDLQRAGYFVKEFVYRIEEAVIRTLLHFGVTGHRVSGAPGIYVRLDDPFGHARLPQRPSHKAQSLASTTSPDFTGLGKIAALGIKVSRNCTYHGLALNVDMDLQPFQCINPCGYPALASVDLSTIGVDAGWEDAARVLNDKLVAFLGA